MITLPSDIQKDPNWNGMSKDPNTGFMVSNRESSMDDVEHLRIACAAKGLLVSLDYTQEEQDANKAKAALMVLKDAYLTNNGGVVTLTKGIHQSGCDPHMQLGVKQGGVSYLYHLDVSADTIVTDNSGHQHFQWRGVRFSARIRNDKPASDPERYDWAFWPEGVQVTVKSNKLRRNSISGPELIALNAKIDAELARQKAQSEVDKRRNSVVSTVFTKLGLSPKNPAQTKKLLAGEQAVFLTKNKQEVTCSFDGTHFHHKGQKMAV